MNTPNPTPAPQNPAAALGAKKAFQRENQKQHNREIGHRVKAASFHRSMAGRSLPHSRGR